MPDFSDASAYTYADVEDLQKQIDALRAKERELTQRSNSIAAETAGFEREKKKLENDIAILLNEIELLEVEIQELNGKIAVNERKINNTQLVISQTLVDMYVSQDVSLIERLASSKSFSSFVDNSARSSSFTDSLGTAVEEIKEMKADLERQKAEVKVKQDNQKTQKKEAENRKAELQRAINMNHAEQQQFAADKDAAVKERKKLLDQQSAIMWELAKDSMSGGYSTNKGGYPWQNECPRLAGQMQLDSYGMYKCECVSYAAWKVYQHFGIKVKNIGRSGSYNGGLWPTRLSGIVPMGKTPKARSVASWSGGPYGHVAWVDYIAPNGDVYVSEYNVTRGQYSERNASKSSGWLNASNATYIYFEQYN